VPGQPDTIGVYRSGTFFLRASNKSGNADLSIVFNVAANAYPIAGNWAGNGYDSVGVFDQQAARFSLCKAATSEACADAANVIQFVFGNPGDQPIVGQWVASATTDQVGIFRAADGLFALKADLSSGSAATMLTFGIPGDVGMLGDWAGNGYDSPGLFRRSTVTFFLSNQPIHSGQALIDSTVNFNTRYRSSTPQDIPIVGDWNGQGYDGIGVFHLGTFELRADSTSGYPDAGFLFGGAGDLPVVGRWPIGVSP